VLPDEQKPPIQTISLKVRRPRRKVRINATPPKKVKNGHSPLRDEPPCHWSC
jgi:hypothetical protein